MAYDDESVDDAPPPQAAPAPAVQGFQEAFTHPVAQEWAQDVGTQLNDYFQRRDIADGATRAGQNFVNNLDSFKSGLASGVQADPNFVHTALDIVPPTVRALVDTLPDIENPNDHHAAVTNHIQSEIAAAAVTSAAEHSEPLARGLLEHPRISGLLGENAGPLDTYISIQAAARDADHQAQVEQLQKDAARNVERSMGNYASALLDPAGGVRFPDGWNQGVMADQRVPPAAKVALTSIYGQLRQNGDLSQSDPFAVSAITRGVASGLDQNVPQILGQAGSSLKLADALMLAGMPKSGAVQLHNALEQGRAALATPENGQAGEEAFAKFTNWLLPAARAGAVLDPSSPDYVLPATRLNGFAPTTANMVDVAYRRPLETRTKLAEIFSNPEYKKPVRERVPASPRVPSGYQMTPTGDIVPIPVGVNPNKAPFYGVTPLSDDQSINPAGTDRDATGKLLREVGTDTGIKALGAADLAHSTSNPRPIAKPALTEEQQKTFQEGGGVPSTPKAAASRNANVRYRPAPAPRGRRK